MDRDVYILGVSMSNHDRSACLLKNGQIAGAIAEERVDRRKRSEGFYAFDGRRIVMPPLAAITYVLRQEQIALTDVDLVVCGRSIRSCREDLLQYLPVPSERVLEPPVPGHHLAHAYSAYGTAPFARAAVLVIDEQGHHLDDGRFEKCSWYEGTRGPLVCLEQFWGGGDDLSLGMFYNAFAALVSLHEAGKPAAGKLMGLAPLGRSRPEWPELIKLDADSEDARVSLSALDEFFSLAGLAIKPGMMGFPASRLDDLLMKYAPVHWDSALAADLARKAQDELERAVLHIAAALRRRSEAEVLAYAGGVALNCAVNRRLRDAGWRDVFVQPAAMDDGASVGLAIYGWVEVLGHPRQVLPRFSPFTGRHYGADDCRRACEVYGLSAYAGEVTPSREGALRAARGEVVCWFHGASEWGPRALGGRSIIASPLEPGIKERINTRIKFREHFRPFAISGTVEALDALLDLAGVPESLGPYMLATGKVRDPRLAEVRHADGTVRYQVVDPDVQPEWYRLIREFGARTGIDAILNTSFNTLGEPLVETPGDAVRQFLLSGADALILEGSVLARAEIPEQVWRAARSRAWHESIMDPLRAALGLEASGYPDAALELLQGLAYTVEAAMSEGPAVVQRYHALLQRAASRSGDDRGTLRHAETVLQWAGLPPEAVGAAQAVAADPTSARRRLAGQFVLGIGLQGAAFRFFTAMMNDTGAGAARDSTR